MKLHQFQPDTFLARYWQRQPLFIEQAIPDFAQPFTVDELAGFACEEDYTSRLITEYKKNDWQLEYGPFNEEQLGKLPRTGWSLLIQDLDKHHHAYTDLLRYFDFIPAWRIDDVMVSLAPDGASVGPHVDNYDVFLFQAEGSKTWKINQHSFDRTDCFPDTDLSILRAFNAEQTFTAKPGDLLYLPPGVAHHGIAEDFSVTYSIGFRSPTNIELLSAYTDDMAVISAQNFYTDTKLSVDTQSNWLSERAHQNLIQHMMNTITENRQITAWLGDYLTQPKPENSEWIEAETTIQKSISLKTLLQYTSLRRKPCCRTLLQVDDESTILFHINGQHFRLAEKYRELAELLSGAESVATAKLREFTNNPEHWIVIESIINTGCYELY